MDGIVTIERVLGAFLGVGITFAMVFLVTRLERWMNRSSTADARKALDDALAEKPKRKNDEVVLLGDDGEVYSCDDDSNVLIDEYVDAIPIAHFNVTGVVKRKNDELSEPTPPPEPPGYTRR